MTYAHWSVDALRGYLVMADALLSGTTSPELRASYATKIHDVKAELGKRSDSALDHRSLAYPAESAMSGSAGS